MSVRRSSAPASRQRRDQRHAVAGEALKAAATALSEQPRSIIAVQHHPGPSFESEPSQTHSLEGGPDEPFSRHNVCRHVN